MGSDKNVHPFLELLKSPPRNPPLPPLCSAAAAALPAAVFDAGAAAGALPSTLLRMGSVSSSCSSLYSAPKMASNRPFCSCFAAATIFVAAGMVRAVDGRAARRPRVLLPPAGDATAGATVPKLTDDAMCVCVSAYCVRGRGPRVLVAFQALVSGPEARGVHKRLIRTSAVQFGAHLLQGPIGRDKAVKGCWATLPFLVPDFQQNPPTFSSPLFRSSAAASLKRGSRRRRHPQPVSSRTPRRTPRFVRDSICEPQQWQRVVRRPICRRNRCLDWLRKRWNTGLIFSIGLHRHVLPSASRRGTKKLSSTWVRTAALIDVFQNTGR